jgi:predicted XRE-type DNA-binding protein
MSSVGRGVEELRVRGDSGSVRVIHIARMPQAVFVLHAFQKKTRATARQDIKIARDRNADDAGAPSKKPGKSHASVLDALAATPEQAANLRARADLMRQIAEIIQEHGWEQAEAAQHCGVTQPRINDLLRGTVSRFSLDALVNIATALGRRVSVALEAA